MNGFFRSRQIPHLAVSASFVGASALFIFPWSGSWVFTFAMLPIPVSRAAIAACPPHGWKLRLWSDKMASGSAADAHPLPVPKCSWREAMEGCLSQGRPVIQHVPDPAPKTKAVFGKWAEKHRGLFEIRAFSRLDEARDDA